MNGRIRKKRKKQQYLTALERGNAYLRDLTKRLMAENTALRCGTARLEEVYEGLALALCEKNGGTLCVEQSRLTALQGQYALAVRQEGETLTLRMQEKQAERG